MKRTLALALAVILILPCFVYADTDLKINYQNNIGELLVYVTDDGSYLANKDGEVLSEAYELISDFNGFAYGYKKGGGKVLYDLDGSVLAETGGEIIPPENGVYGVLVDSEDYTLCREFVLYDYETRELLHTFDRVINYHLEQQTDKMFIEKDGKFAITDKYGNFLTDYIYDGLKKRFNPDYYPFPEAYAIVVVDGEEKYIDWELNEIDLDNYNGKPFITNCHRINDGGTEYNNELYVLENRDKTAIYDYSTETYITEFQNDYTYRAINESYIIAQRKEKDGDRGKYGALSYSGDEVVPFKYDTLYFNENNGIDYRYYDYDADSVREGTLDTESFGEVESEFEQYGEFYKALGLHDKTDIGSGVFVYGDGRCAELSDEELKSVLDRFWNFGYEMTVAPAAFEMNEYNYYLKLWNKDGTKSYTIFDNAGMIAGFFGTPTDGCSNYVWYMPLRGNGTNSLYTAMQEVFHAHNDTDRYITENERYDLPSDDNNLLPIAGASSWAEPEIQRAAAKNLLVYELTDKYGENITRNNFCQLAARLIATAAVPSSDSRAGQFYAISDYIDSKGLREKFNSIKFTDTEDINILSLSALGIIEGMGDGSFAPDESITREQAATILCRMARVLEYNIPDAEDRECYTDSHSISEWARDSVISMYLMDIMHGEPDGCFYPANNYTLEQAIATMLRLYEYNR